MESTNKPEASDSGKKQKKQKLNIHKQVKRINREQQLKSGVKLTTKVIPDKTKYTRKGKTNLPPQEQGE